MGSTGTANVMESTFGLMNRLLRLSSE
jgi:hypothetical protein